MSRAKGTAHIAGLVPNSQQLFNRVVRLTIGLGKEALVITGLRVVAKTHKTQTPGPATAEVSVYNLNKDHRAALKQRGIKILLEAGYSNTLGAIFSGNAFFIDHVHTGPDVVTKIQLMDGGGPYAFNRLVQSWGPGTAVSTVATALVAALGPQASGTAAVIASIPGAFQRGYSVQGAASKELTTLLGRRGYIWRFQDGAVRVLQKGGSTQETAVLLTPSTGLVGSPEHGTPDVTKPFDSVHTLKVKALLQPTIKVWGRVAIQAEGIGTPENPALYTAFSVEDDLDSLGTEGSPWYTNIEATPYGTLPPIGRR